MAIQFRNGFSIGDLVHVQLRSGKFLGTVTKLNKKTVKAMIYREGRAPYEANHYYCHVAAAGELEAKQKAREVHNVKKGIERASRSRSFYVGDRVSFLHKGMKLTGYIKKKNRVRFKINVDNDFREWSVPPHMLNGI